MTNRQHIADHARRSAADGRATLRRHDRRRDDAGVVHLAADARQACRGGGAGTRPEDGTGPGAARARQGSRPQHTFFVVYGSSNHLVDLSEVVVQDREFPLLAAKEVNLAIRNGLRRKLVVVGACIGTDAHTVGIDAILNVKGFAGEKGLEYYREISVVNLGAQVFVPELVARARAEHADAVLVSQVVTQRDAHIHNTTRMSAAFREAYPAGTVPLLVVGGPRFEEDSAARLGVDRIFGRGTTPSEVASYLVHALVPPAAASRRTAS